MNTQAGARTMVREVGWLAAAVVAGVASALAVTLAGVQLSAVTVVAAAGIGLLVLTVRDVRFGILAMLLALPLEIYGRVSTDPVVTLYQITLLVTLAAWAWNLLRGTTRLQLSAVDPWVLALLLAAAWSVPFSLSRGETLFAAARLVFVVLFFKVVEEHADDQRFFRRVMVTLSVTAVVFGILAALQHFVPGFDFGNTSVRLGTGVAPIIRGSGFFEDPNYLGGLLSVTLASGLLLALVEEKLPRMLPWLAVSAISAIGLYATLSRTAWVGAAVGVALAIWFAPRHRRTHIALGLLGVGTVVVLAQPEMFVARFASIFDIQGDMSNSTRWFMFISAARIIQDNWAMGVGLAAFAEAYPAYREFGTFITVLKPHQLPLAVWAEMGIAGMIAQTGLTVSFGVLTVRAIRRGLSLESRVALIGLATLVIQTWFQYFLFYEYLWLFLALAAVALRRDIDREGVTP